MKFLKSIFVLIFIFHCTYIFGQDSNIQQSIPEGISLCNEVFSTLKKSKCNPKIQALVSSGENEFPYNIIMNSEKNDSSDQLIFTFNMEDAYENLDLIIEIENKLKKLNFNSTIFLVYGNKQSFIRYSGINGTNVFINSLDTNQNNIAYNISFTNGQSSVISGTRGFTSPSWMITQVYNAFRENETDFDFPFIYISQLSKLRFATDRVLSTFLMNDIPSVTVNFTEELKNSETLSSILNYFIDDFENSKDKINDYHSLMIHFPGSTIWFSEKLIIIILIFIVLITMAYIFILSYINFNKRSEYWIELKNNWYTLPITFLLSLAGFYAGKGIYRLIYMHNMEKSSVFSILIIQLVFAIAFISLFYLLEMFLLKKRYSGKSVDLLTLLITFLNQFIFCFADVSLFPIFFLIFVGAMIVLLFKKNWIHSILLVLIFGGLCIYGGFLVNSSNASTLKMFFYTSRLFPVIMTLLLMPIYMLWLRILTNITAHFTKKRISAIVIGSAYIVSLLFFALLNNLIYQKLEKNVSWAQVLPVTDRDEIFSLEYKDSYIFGELIRNIHFTSTQEPQMVRISIEGKKSMPVLYSEYDFTIDSNKKATVSIPLCPGKKIDFRYGADKQVSEVKAEAIYKTDNKNEFFLVTKTIHIEGSNGKE